MRPARLAGCASLEGRSNDPWAPGRLALRLAWRAPLIGHRPLVGRANEQWGPGRRALRLAWRASGGPDGQIDRGASEQPIGGMAVGPFTRGASTRARRRRAGGQD